MLILGDNLYVSFGSSPCETLWTNVPLGTCTIDVVATDDRGARTHAQPVTIHVAASNNDFESRRPLFADLPAAGSTLGATKQPGEPNHGGNVGGASLWRSWTAPVGGNVLSSTEGSRFDTLLAVYVGGSVSNLTLVAGNDNVTPFALHSEVAFRAEAGVEYQIALDGAAGAVGDFRLFLRPGVPNDNFEDRLWIANLSQPVTGANFTASRQLGEPFHGFGFGRHSVWSPWTAPHSGSFTLATAGSSFDTLLGIYRGGALSRRRARQPHSRWGQRRHRRLSRQPRPFRCGGRGNLSNRRRRVGRGRRHHRAHADGKPACKFGLSEAQPRWRGGA